MGFSPDGDEYLASAGKDRTLCIHASASFDSTSAGRESGGDGGGGSGNGLSPYRHVVSVPAAHKRIIWVRDSSI